jgi:hypothetical protein
LSVTTATPFDRFSSRTDIGLTSLPGVSVLVAG